jgi:2,3-bisphosphoglycerate-dependent phosphoglycerate mutase
MRRVWLIRHGESTANAGEITSDPGSIPLTQLGQSQARNVAEQFDRAPSLIVTSKYLRTQETAAPTIERFPDVPRAEWNIHEFTYLSLESCADKSFMERKPLVDAYWERCDPLHVDGEGAESFSLMLDRVDELLGRLQSGREDFIAIFTHGQLMRAALWMILGNRRRDVEAMRLFRAFDLAYPIQNAAIAKLVIDSDDGTIYTAGAPR